MKNATTLGRMATDRPEGLPASTGTLEMWWGLRCNALDRGDVIAHAVALAQYRRAADLEM